MRGLSRVNAGFEDLLLFLLGQRVPNTTMDLPETDMR